MPAARGMPAPVLHGGWVLARGSEVAGFAIWGEEPLSPRGRPLTTRKRKQLPRRPPPHPFALTDDGIRHALSMLGLTTWATQGSVRQVAACLPSTEAGPHRSTDPFEAVEGDRQRLEAWDLPAVVLDEVASVVLLPRIAAASANRPAILGDDLRAWIVAARFALSLLARQRFLPRAQPPDRSGEGPDLIVARWSPVVDEPADLANLRALERAIPPAGLGLAWETGGERPTAREAVADFVAAVVDGVARRARPPHPPLAKKAGPVDAWLTALASDDCLVHLTEDVGEALRRQIGAWSALDRAVATDADAAFRLCFRLVPPLTATTTDKRPWRLDYLLQATDDPSLLVPIGEVWRQRGAAARFLTRRFDQPQERVLAGLGRASRLFPPIEASLHEARPEGCWLSTREAADLVRDRALLLKASGFGVLLPGLDTRLNIRLRLRSGPEPDASKTPGLGVLSFDSLVNYDWQLALGDQALTREEFEMLAQLKEPLVQLRGRWVDVRPDQIERALAFIQRHRDGRMELGEALATALAPTSLDGVPVTHVESSGWLDRLLSDVRQGTTPAPTPDPPGFQGHLRPYQQRGLTWLATLRTYSLGALLADDMGLGKALSLQTRILTADGWKKMADIRIGDDVINSQGTTSRVKAVYPQGEKELYRVVFSDGTSVECCEDHLWYVTTPVRKHRGQPGRVLALRDIRRDLRDAAGNCKHYIPMVRPIEFAERPLPLNPYIFGVLLGDGGLTDHTPRITSADGEILASLRVASPAGVTAPRQSGTFDWRLTAHGSRSRANPLTLSLRELGLMGGRSAEKFIPDVYKFASVASRTALLQGLLDTDGCVRAADNNIEYSTVSRQLAEDVAFVVQSLGGTVRIRTKQPRYPYRGERRDGRTAYRMSIILPAEIQPFRLERKARLYHARPKYPPTRAIVDVQPVGRKPAQCIAVDAPDGLYVTQHCILTHNTAQIIGLLLTGERAGPSLVICPTSVVGNWRHEIGRFAPALRVLVHHGAGRAAGEELAATAAEHDVVLSTYSLLHRDEASLTGVGWDGLILDEAQNIKNASTRAAQAARAVRARWRVALTGTPVENRLADLWSIFQVVNPGYLGSAEEFRRQFALPIERASDADAINRLKALTAPFILRRVKTDRSVIADLPEKQEMKVYCSLTREQATLYEAVVQDVMRQIAESEGIQRRGLVLGLLTKLKQVCDHPALLLHDASPLPGRSGKLARLGEMLEEVIAEEEHALVFTQYAEMGRLLQTYLTETLEREVLFLHGGTPLAERDHLVSLFQSEAGPPVFVLSLKAGGTGLNLTRANHVFHFDRWWNPAVENQATDRAFRIGQTRNVQVHKYLCSGTFEEALDELIGRKVQLAEAIVGTSEAWITELSTEELGNLFRLRREDAVAED